MPAIQKTAARLTSDPSKVISRSIPPNRMTAAFNEMKDICPDAIRLYATCVSNNHTSGHLEKDSCTSEFAAVKDCFRNTRGRA
mmetsp:Transcript_19978/g.29202  ORF Transcript_19978/g.29202 Transcript_19978/m.29202 type:complete len:83 (-) Transcript_19978:241-489(-)|eukprot:CAMPEP_0197259368 /NCGR_PEP_ID=MMETSP1429-20130617/83481_1 /TAXON_ID=49237 /ORGANISM="Chaetoceros  sp., Strain UNC1202" /LENGTH=82 /DNA_ID=CAMNT_0042723573 /DNA_START=44 /DNA_END=292 /DNA_ORIENTATION=+